MGKQTPLYDWHVSHGARMVDFGGWDMPLHYGSQLEEHHQVRRDAGVFDVSHMTTVDFSGNGARDFLRMLLANDVGRLNEPGKALYSCMLNETAGVVDDLIVYYMSDDWYRMVINAGTTEKDLAWIGQQAAAHDVTFRERSDLAMLAVQGPAAGEKMRAVLPGELLDAVAGLKTFFAASSGDYFVGRTGYTGEDGYEMMLPAAEATVFADKLIANGIAPCGLGARDTLRLEAGMNLYGSDMDETTSPLESGLGWTIAWEPESREFVGRAALTAQRGSTRYKFVGLVLKDKGVLRDHQAIFDNEVQVGELTSGGFSPTLNRSIALARIEKNAADELQADVRGRRLSVSVVKPPFVRNGEVKIKID